VSTVVATDGRLLSTELPKEAFGGAYMVSTGGQGNIRLSGALTATYEAIYEANPSCFALVNKLARLLSTLPVKVYDRPASEDQPEEIRSHPLSKLLNQPAPRRSQAYWKQGLIRPALIHGNGLLAKWRGPTKVGEPKAILPVAWPYVGGWAPLGCPVKFWSTTQDGTVRYFTAADSVHLAWESQDLHGLGVSPLKPLAETIKLDDALRRYQTASMGNAARPSKAIIPPPGYQYEANEKEVLKAEMQRVHGGVDNAMKDLLLAPGFDVKVLSQTAVEAEVIAARAINTEEFARAYDVPPPMIGDLTHGTYSNVEELHRILYVTTLRPWFRFVEEILQAQLVEEEEWSSDIYVQFDLAEVLRGNRREELDAASQAFNNGLMTLNEAREFVDLPPVKPETDPEGLADVPHIQANNMRPITQPAAPENPDLLPAGATPDVTQPKPATPTQAKRESPLREDLTNR
jgi:HK97 family phage portal protein